MVVTSSSVAEQALATKILSEVFLASNCIPRNTRKVSFSLLFWDERIRMKNRDHLFMEIPGAAARQLYVSLSRKRPTRTHMNSQTLSLSGEEEEFIWALSKQINFCLAHTLQLPA